MTTPINCTFLDHGISLQYHDFLKPCCTWKHDTAWSESHKINNVNIINWHKNSDLTTAKKQLADGIWPTNCSDCQSIESIGRGDSMRLNGISAYNSLNGDDLILEIRPGDVCNFACQTCWPFASTRVATFYKLANINDPFKNLTKHNLTDYDFLLSIAHRLKTIIILGGEPFYDPKCLQFLNWILANTSHDTNLVISTNGSFLNLDILCASPRKFTLVFSLDAINKPAEYIRFGTNWSEVLHNFNIARTLPNVEVRVNITTSIYNFYYFPDLIELLIPNWPSVVSFGSADELMFNENVIPLHLRASTITRLTNLIPLLQSANIEHGQKTNAINAIQSIITKFNLSIYDATSHLAFKEFVSKMDLVKKISFAEYCPEMITLLD